MSDVGCQMSDVGYRISDRSWSSLLISDIRHPTSELREGLRVAVDGALELAGGRVVEIVRGADRFEHIGMLRAQRGEQAVLEPAHPIDRKRIEVAVDARIDDGDLLLHLERGELRLFEQFGQARA